MDNNYNVIFGLCAIVALLTLFIILFTYFLCRLENIGYTSQTDNTQVLLHQCEDPLHNPYIYVTVSPPTNIDPILESAI